MRTTEFDVVVAGAGPSGCAAAIALKLAGINVCLVDKEHSAGRKVGESIPGASVRLLKRLGINGVEELLDTDHYKQCFSNASSWGSEEWVFQSGLKNPEGGGYHINRAAFDEALKTKASSMGVPIHLALIDKADFLDKDKPELGYNVEFKNSNIPHLTTKWIIDATGRKAAIGRKFGVKRMRLDNQMAAVNWIDAPTEDNDHATRVKSVADGWWYTSLLPDKSRVIGFQSLPETVSLMHKNPDVFLKKFNETHILPYKIARQSILQSIAVEAGLAKSQSVITNHVLCVGDAALSFDPLSSQGIFFSLYSGIKGAEAIINCLNSLDASANVMDDYPTIIERIFKENLNSLKHFYLNEFRYQNESYWKRGWNYSQ